MLRLILPLLLLATSSLACGVHTRRVDVDQDDPVGGTGVDSADLRMTADKMARSILGVEKIFAKGTPYVVVMSPENRTRFQIDDSIFVTKIVTLLNQSAEGRIQFVDRSRWEAVQKERELKRSGAVSTPTDETGQPKLAAAPLGTDYFLTGELQALSKTTGRAASDYILATFKLIDAETNALMWQDDAEWKKVGAAGIVYR
jgi:hypothetical protein